MRPTATRLASCGGASVVTTNRSRSWSRASYPFAIDETSAPLVVDTRPLVRGVAGDRLAGVAPAVIARRFHTTLTDVIVAVCRRLRETTGLSRVVLTGGCFLNAILSSGAASRQTRAGFDVYRHRLVPPGDGGICLGQLAVAAVRHAAAREGSITT